MKTLSKISLAVVVAAVLRLGCPELASALSTNVMVGPNGTLTFSPASVTIHAGDRVIWTWSSTTIGHSTTSGTNGVAGDDNGVPSGSWSSGLHVAPYSFTNTFTSPGVFTYFCSAHYSFGMTGVVQVLPLPPTAVVLTNAALTNGNFAFTALTTPHQTNVVQGTTNLAAGSDWVPLETNVPATNTFRFTDTNVEKAPFRFYRVVNP